MLEIDLELTFTWVFVLNASVLVVSVERSSIRVIRMSAVLLRMAERSSPR